MWQNMMNFVAIAFLLSYLSAVVVFVPEPQLGRADLAGDGSVPAGLFGPPKGAAQNPGCDDENCPSYLGQVKGTLHKGYEKTAEGIDRAKEGAEETVQGVYEHSRDKAEQAKEGIQDGAYESAQAIQDRTGQAKQGVYDTAHYASSGLKDKAEQVKQGMEEVPEKVSSYIPSKEEAVSYVPGAETGREAANTVRQKAGEVKARISLDSLRIRLDELRKDAGEYMKGKEREESDSGFFDMKRKLDEASSYITGKETAGAYMPGMDSIENMKRGVQDTAQDAQGRVLDAGESVRDATKEGAQGMYDKSHDAADSAHGAGEGFKGKVGGMFQGIKNRFGGGAKGRGGSGPLERRVQDLCMWLGDGSSRGRAPPVFLDVAATRHSYTYLMQSALGAIDRAQEVFDHATSDNAGGEWREKYVYLADSSKGALDASKEVFERAVSAAEGTLRPRRAPSQKAFSYGSEKNMSKFKVAAVRTKETIYATMRPLTRTLYLATFSAVYGLALWMTFLSGHLLSQALPRQQLGYVQGKLFPVYLRIITGSIAFCGIIHAVLHPWPSADRPEHWQYLNLALCIAAGLLNMFVVEPRATKLVVEKLKVEKEEGRGQSGQELVDDDGIRASIDTKLKGYHQIASSLNLVIVAGLTWHLWYLANRLVV